MKNIAAIRLPLLAIFAMALSLASACSDSSPLDGENPGGGRDDGGVNKPYDPPDGVVPAEPETIVETGTPAGDEILFNETVRFQKLDGIGANAYTFPFANDLGWNWDAVKWVFDELDLHYIRLASWFEFWEPQKGVYDSSRIIENHDVGFAKFLDEKGIDVELGVWNVADWMLASTSPRRVAPSRYPDLGHSIATYLTNMEENGIPMSITEVQNEPGIQASLIYNSPEDVRDAARALIEQLDAEGHEDVMIHGPNWHAPNQAAANAAEVWFADDEVAARTAALSFHTWWEDSFESFDRLRRIAEENGKPVWATEVGYCALPNGCGNGHYLRPETWETAWDFAMSYYRAIAWSRAERVYHWTVVGFDGLVDPGTGAATPSLHVVKHFANFISPGSRLVDTASGDADVLSLGFLHPNGERTLILLNTAGQAKDLALTDVVGGEPKVIEAITTSRGNFEVETEMLSSGGELQVTLPPQSVTSIRF